MRTKCWWKVQWCYSLAHLRTSHWENGPRPGSSYFELTSVHGCSHLTRLRQSTVHYVSTVQFPPRRWRRPPAAVQKEKYWLSACLSNTVGRKSSLSRGRGSFYMQQLVFAREWICEWQGYRCRRSPWIADEHELEHVVVAWRSLHSVQYIQMNEIR